MPNSAQPQSTQPAPRGEVEPASVSFRGVVFFVIGLAVTLAIVDAALGFMFRGLKNAAKLEDQQIQKSGVTAPVRASRVYFPAPREQFSPQLDLRSLQAQQETELNSYGWVDRSAGVVRIPIDRAMDLISQRGLPTRKASNVPTAGPSTLQLQQQRPTQSSPPTKEEGK